MISQPSQFLAQTAAAAVVNPCVLRIGVTAVLHGRRSDAAAVPGTAGIEMAAADATTVMMNMERMAITVTAVVAAAANGTIRR